MSVKKNFLQALDEIVGNRNKEIIEDKNDLYMSEEESISKQWEKMRSETLSSSLYTDDSNSNTVNSLRSNYRDKKYNDFQAEPDYSYQTNSIPYNLNKDETNNREYKAPFLGQDLGNYLSDYNNPTSKESISNQVLNSGYENGNLTAQNNMTDEEWEKLCLEAATESAKNDVEFINKDIETNNFVPTSDMQTTGDLPSVNDSNTHFDNTSNQNDVPTYQESHYPENDNDIQKEYSEQNPNYQNIGFAEQHNLYQPEILHQPEIHQPEKYQPEELQAGEYQPEEYQSEEYQPEKYQPEEYQSEEYHQEVYHQEEYQQMPYQEKPEQETIYQQPTQVNPYANVNENEHVNMSNYNIVENTVISEDTRIIGTISSANNIDFKGVMIGDIEGKGAVHVSGAIHGDVNAQQVNLTTARIIGNVESKSTVNVDEQALIKGNISANVVELNGKIKGSLYANLAKLTKGSLMVGDITANEINIEQGARIKGQVNIDCEIQANELDIHIE